MHRGFSTKTCFPARIAAMKVRVYVVAGSNEYRLSIPIVPDLAGIRSGKLKSGAAPGVLCVKSFRSTDAPPSNALQFHERRHHHQAGEVACSNQAHPKGVRSRIGCPQVNAPSNRLGRRRIFEQKPDERLTPARNEIVSFGSSIDSKTMGGERSEEGR